MSYGKQKKGGQKKMKERRGNQKKAKRVHKKKT